jgi:hypothetical protein
MGIVAIIVAAVLLLSPLSAPAAEQRPETLDRCGLDFVNCATGPESDCLVDAVQLDDACVQKCERAWDACLRADGARSGPRAEPRRRPSSLPDSDEP